MTLGFNSSTAPAPSRQHAGFPPSDQARAAIGPESKSLSGESPEDSDAVQKEVEFKEGGYGWLVSPSYPILYVYLHYLLTFMTFRVVVFGVWLVNMHTWGLNSVRLPPRAFS